MIFFRDRRALTKKEILIYFYIFNRNYISFKDEKEKFKNDFVNLFNNNTNLKKMTLYTEFYNKILNLLVNTMQNFLDDKKKLIIKQK